MNRLQNIFTNVAAPLIAAATDAVFIPMEAGVESLNAGVAASVLAFELYRGRC